MEVLYIVNLIDDEYSRKTVEQLEKKLKATFGTNGMKQFLDASKTVSNISEKK